MEPDRRKARNTSRIMLYVVLALFVVLAIALVGSCQESNVAPDRVEPEESGPVEREPVGAAPLATPLVLAA